MMRDDERRLQSGSEVQREAETAMLKALERDLGSLVRGKRIEIGSAHVVVDGASVERRVLVEVYARIGKLKGGQPKKVAQDILKLALIRQQCPEWHGAKAVIAFACNEAAESVVGWLALAAKTFGVKLRVVELDADLRGRIEEVQRRQKMVNVDLEPVIDAG